MRYVILASLPWEFMTTVFSVILSMFKSFIGGTLTCEGSILISRTDSQLALGMLWENGGGGRYKWRGKRGVFFYYSSRKLSLRGFGSRRIESYDLSVHDGQNFVWLKQFVKDCKWFVVL